MADTPSRLMLISPPLGADADFGAPLAAALSAAPFAAVVLRTDYGADERALLKMLKPLIEAVQAAGAAALIEGSADLVGKSGADGLHVLGDKQAREAISRFKPDKIVGAGGLRTKDAAMSAGEVNTDYVLFGDPGKGGDVPLDIVVERCGWWAEIFTTPCVGQAETFDSVAPIAATRADFVALGAFVWTHKDGPAAAVKAAAEQIPALESAP
ncbi:thiamine phosphate synthase [Terrihabitans soli]|uniref:Thiamine phosphate synthase n=1 Tax=Terrihabitans soli TaxID=708113 RepID=A0A6S6QFI2_9HYPH|nr:thiamine phosphate synthase [Terrihabitans soli]BCJ89853.1 thiamine phosphate synthase [Terrihabitans soli]